MNGIPKNLVIAMDGPAGAGKSTGARGLAAKLGYRYVDTGAMYRAAAWAVRRAKISPNSAAMSRVVKAMRLDFRGRELWINGENATDAIRTPEVSQAASRLATRPALRRLLVSRQRAMGRGGGVVMEGRDIGSVVFPRAAVKFFIDASPEERARRRWLELRAKGQRAALADIAHAIRERDARDRGRRTAPLVAARDAVVVDTTGMSPRQTLGTLLEWVKRKTR